MKIPWKLSKLLFFSVPLSLCIQPNSHAVKISGYYLCDEKISTPSHFQKRGWRILTIKDYLEIYRKDPKSLLTPEELFKKGFPILLREPVSVKKITFLRSKSKNS